MDSLFTWIESTGFSTFLREEPSLWVFPFILILHTVGLAFLVGVNVAIGLRILGVAPGVPLATLARYYVVMWVGFWINAVSGVLLLIAYPTKALTNPLFYVKLLMIFAALALASGIRTRIAGGSVRESGAAASRLRLMAIASLTLWALSITAGRFLAYTYKRLLVDLAG